MLSIKSKIYNYASQANLSCQNVSDKKFVGRPTYSCSNSCFSCWKQ